MRDPTRYVMLTVVVGLDASGASSTRRPLARRYSVMPSIEDTSETPAGSDAAPAWKARNDDTNNAFRRRDRSGRRMGMTSKLAESVGVYTFRLVHPGRDARGAGWPRRHAAARHGLWGRGSDLKTGLARV
ncbi:Uncharacterised protein [Bordetella pertussis]|nr:Uncharacterised protein [Bordetella pertussis]